MAPAEETTSQRVASYTVIVITTIVTFVAARYILRAMMRAKPDVIYDRRKARFVPPLRCPFCAFLKLHALFRQAKIELGSSYYNNNNDSTLSTFNPNPSDSDIPLQPYDPEREAAGYGGGPSSLQQWDESGHAVGYAPDPRLHAPRPRAPTFSPTALYTSPAVAAAATASQDPEEDEWTNAQSPKTAHPSNALPRVDFPSPPRSPRSPEAQYLPYNPEQFAENTPTAAAAAAAVRQNTRTLASESSSPPLRALSPPPGYR